MKSNQQNTT